MNIFKIFDTIEEAVGSSQRLPAPFSQWSIINRHNFMRLMDKMRSSVSPELKSARDVNKNMQRLLTEAQDQANQIVDKAKENARQQHEAVRAERESIINATEVVQLARKRAEEIENAARHAADEIDAQTRARCQELRREAEEYARQVRRKAEQDARTHEAELERYAVKLLEGMERELGRAMQIVRSNRQQVVSRNEGADPEEDTATLEPALVRQVVAATTRAQGGATAP